MQDVLERFFAAESNVYLILQLKSGPETRNEQFESLDRLAQMGKKPDLVHYEDAYFANTPAYLHGMDTAEALEELYMQFNLYRPPDFKGHSLSVSDVIALKLDGHACAFFVDRIGFKELPEFLEKMKETACSRPSLKEQLKRPERPDSPAKGKKHRERDTR